MNTDNPPIVAIIMGSNSDLKVMSAAAEVLEDFQVPIEISVVSAHRTPDRMVQYARSAADRGIGIIIAGAGGAAHLPGMVAAMTPLPVIGVPVKSSNSLDGWDSILSILQMPAGVPVATVALNQARNAGLLAVRMLAVANPTMRERMQTFLTEQCQRVENIAAEMSRRGWREFL